MGSLTTGQQIVDAILEVLPTFGDSLAEAERWLSCRDQVKQLTVAVENILTQGRRVIHQASLDYKIKSDNALLQQSVDLAVTAITILIRGRVVSRSERTAKAPRLGKVVIAVGPEGLPEDLMVVNVSDLAEQEGKTDKDVERVLSDDGQRLFNIEEFKVLASWLAVEVLCGRVSLPYQLEVPRTPVSGAIRLPVRR